MTPKSVSGKFLKIVLRLLVAACGAFALWSGARPAWRAGAARTLSEFSLIGERVYASNSDLHELLAPADEAVRMSPADPATHQARATLLDYAGRPQEAVKAAEEAVSRRPQDYFLWLTLGQEREHAGDFEGARAAYHVAINRAPFYAKPHWQLGNLLFRAGRIEDAFAEMRRALETEPQLFGYAAQLAWSAYKGDARAVERAVAPATDEQRLTLARLYAQHGLADEAVAQLRSIKNPAFASPEGKDLLGDLLKEKRYAQAYQVWAYLNHSSDESVSQSGRVTNGSFEEPLLKDSVGFDWQLNSGVSNVRFALDSDRPHSGSRSLRLDFSGDTGTAAQMLSQIVIVKPNAKYRLTWAARAQGIVSGALPIVSVYDAATPQATDSAAAPSSSASPHPLSQTAALPTDSKTWQEYALDFATPPNCGAVIIALQRQPCSSPPCPIFGHLWLDDFAITKL